MNTEEYLAGQRAGLNWARQRIAHCEQAGQHPDDMKRAADWLQEHMSDQAMTEWFEEAPDAVDRLLQLLYPDVETQQAVAAEYRALVGRVTRGVDFFRSFAEAMAASYGQWQHLRAYQEGEKQKNIDKNRRAIDRDPEAENN